MKERIKRNWKLLLNIFTIIFLGLAVYFLREDIAKAFSELGRLNGFALLLVVLFQVQNFAAQSHIYQEFLMILGKKVSFKQMYKVALEVNFINLVFPSGGVAGFSYFAARLKPYGISTAQSTFTHTMRFILTFASFVILLFIGLFLLALGGSASNMIILITCCIAFIGLILIVGGVYIVSSNERINGFTQGLTRIVNRVISLIRPKHPETINLKRVEKVFSEMHGNYEVLKRKFPELKRPFLYSLLANVTELATIYSVYIAYGQFVNPGAVIVAYALANFAGLIAILPGGVGVYEALMSLVLVSAGVPAGLAISVTVMYRILTMGLQLSSGYYFYHKALKEIEGLPTRTSHA